MTVEKATMRPQHSDASSPVELKKFSRVMAIALPLIFGLFIPWLWDLAFPAWPWIVGAVFLATGQFVPRALYWPYKLWFKLAEYLGWFNSRVILGIVYFLMFTPIALLLKVFGKSPLDNKGILHEDSYRIESPPRNDKHFERPF